MTKPAPGLREILYRISRKLAIEEGRGLGFDYDDQADADTAYRFALAAVQRAIHDTIAEIDKEMADDHANP